jgi:predicted aldo/keto reductase-like oxidoreductase
MAIATRRYQDGIELSIIGFGAIVVCGHPQNQANQIVDEAIQRGVRYFDVAPAYFKGEAEEKLGKALEGKRDKVFLACKTNKRDAHSARQELENSLTRLRTDHLDLYQFHGVSSMKDVETILSPQGAGEVFAQAQREGKVSHLGFSAHNMEAGISLLRRAPFKIDSVLFPINVVCIEQGGGFGLDLLQEATQAGAARLALKAMARQVWPAEADRSGRKTWYQPMDDPHYARLALRWTLGQDITAAVPPGEVELFRLAMETAENYKPLEPEEQAQLSQYVESLNPIFSTPNVSA